MAGLLGGVSFVNAGYGGEVVVGAPGISVLVPTPPVLVVPAPPMVVVPVPGISVVGPGFGFFPFGGGYDRRRDEHDFSHRGAESRGAAHHDDGGRRR